MSESQTPRTDKAKAQMDAWIATDVMLQSRGSFNDDPMPPDGWKVARQLESELTATRARLAELEGIAERPRRVCLCGSSRWPDAHHKAMMEETLAGRIVIPMGLYGHADYPIGAKAATNDGDEATEVKQMLDRLHFAKIDLADEILVVNVGGYIGSSTAREIEYAKQNGKTVRFLEAHKEGKK